ncbi:MAG: capsular biosynthesis protein [Polyangiaceae bacterium]|nr:capsular biosynthesis protein [Polyangiaceae bacterium]
MRILFIENRQQTALWEALIPRLAKLGIEAAWLVQNPAFSPSSSQRRFLLPFPPKENQGASLFPDELEHFLRRVDRGYRFFEAGSEHYAHYFGQISTVFDSFEPALVIGETTLFHELIAEYVARQRGVPYYFPATTRYPAGRFSFFRGRSLVQGPGSEEELSERRVGTLIGEISQGSTLPDYMRRVQRGAFSQKALAVSEKARTTWGRWRGERFNTPTVRRKLALNREAAYWRGEFEKEAALLEESEDFVLFPLQMEPEANLDVWGHDVPTQRAALEMILESLPPQTLIAVKPNPKSKYEMNRELVDLIRADSRCKALPFGLPMLPLMKKARATVTVTGSVAMECVFRGLAGVVLSREMKSYVPDIPYAGDPDGLRSILVGPTSISEETAKAYLRGIVRRSHPGIISNPYSYPQVLHEENLSYLERAFSILLAAH